jgi:SpoIID/LytB domain protein
MIIERRHAARPRRRSVRRPAALVAIALLLAALAPAVHASPAVRQARPAVAPGATAESAPDATTLASTITFYGRGAGHGVGMSQYGARGRAKAGESATRILAAYYRRARPATTDPDQAVRVLLLDDQPATAANPLVVHGRGGEWRIDGLDGTFPAGAELRVWQPTTALQDVSQPAPGPALEVLAADGSTQLFAGAAPVPVVVRPAEAATRLQLDAKPAAHDTYRGTLRVVLDGTTARVVNRLGLDDYLRGVLPAEMPSSWPGAALKAQAIAARSYAVRRLHPGTGAFDLYDTWRTQVYLGAKVETDRTNAIIDGAPGAILVKGKHDRAINAFYHSTGGGGTENNEYAFVGPSGTVTASPVTYLRGFADRDADGRAYDADAPLYRWSTASLTRAQLTSIFKRDSRTSVGDLTKLDLTHRGVSGRLYRVTLYGSSGAKTVSADVFVAVFNAGRPAGTAPLRSTLFDTRPIK